MARPIQGAREALRTKVTARQAARKAADSKWARLRQVAAEEPKDAEAAMTELGEALGCMADAMSNLRENLDLIEAPKTASLAARIAATRNYASRFKLVAEQSPEVVADALGEVYHSLDDVAGAVENLAEWMGLELSLTPVEKAFGEEGKEELAGDIPAEEEKKPEVVDEGKFEEAEKEIEESPEAEEKAEEGEEKVEEEIEKEAAATEWTTDRDEEGEPKAPVLAAKKDKKDLKPGEFMDGDEKKKRCKSCGTTLVKGKCPVSAKDCGRGKKAKLARVDWKATLQDNYDNDFEQFEAYDDIYAISKRLGFPDALSAWEANPEIGGSTDPNDLQIIDPANDDPNDWEEAESYMGHTRKNQPVMASGEFFITDRDNSGAPEAPEKLEIPESQGETEVGKAAGHDFDVENGKAAAAKVAMSKKDYILLADAIKSFEVDDALKQKLALHLSGFLKQDNGAFNEQTFIKYVTGTGGPSGGKR